jgi:integrase
MTQAIVQVKTFKPARFRRGDLSRAYPELPDYLTLDEAHAIIDAAQAKQRDCLLFSLLWQTGLRISEALSLTSDNIRAIDIRVKGKGGKVRVIPIKPQLINQLLRYALDKHIPYGEPFFNITRSQAHRLANKYAVAAGITRKVHCHLFRHGFAVNFLRQTGNIVYLQELLGHSSIETTRIYVRAALPDVREALEKVEF